MNSEDEDDWAVIEEIRARGPMWIPVDEASSMMDQMIADAEDAAAVQEWEVPKASGLAVTVSHGRRLGLD